MRASTLILEPHKPLGGFLGMMRGRVPRQLGGIIDPNTVMPFDSPAPSQFAPEYSPNYTDYLYNIFTGNLSTGEQNQLINETAQNYVAAGMAPTQAATQAASDVNAALANVTAPGAFGITTTGALPSSGASGTLANLFGEVPGWAWVGILGIGGLLLARKLL